jgi:hypothetical protein
MVHKLFFLCDPWIDGMVLKNSFSRLFDLATNKMATVAEMYSLGRGRVVKLGGGGVVCYHGRRRRCGSVVIF